MSEDPNIPKENTNEQVLNYKGQEVNENISLEQTIEQSETSNSKPTTQNMEVHKHPHHVTHKKKWGEYLLEFLMIFFAVFLGFVAENIRETSVEWHQEKEYMHLMVEDL